MKQYLMPSYGEIMKHALTCKAIGAEVCSSVWCEFVLVKINMNQLGVILYLNMYVCKFEPIQHVFRQKAFCKESILFHSYTLFYSLQRGQGIFIAINYTHVFSGDPFYERFCESEPKLRQAVAVLPWGHTLKLMRKFGEDDNAISYYAQETLSKGWNRDLLSSAISLKMHTRKSESLDNNFEQTLPATQAMFANEVFKSGYNLGFLGIKDPILETELETRLVEKVKHFLLELGKGFTYLGNQYVLEYNGKRSKVDMLFFHRGLHCLVAIDLKIGEFKPEYAGKMNYYLSLLDRLERREDENRSIGIILCAEKDRVEVELALEDMGKPIGVADYQLIVPQEELKKVVADEMEAFGKELPLRTGTEE